MSLWGIRVGTGPLMGAHQSPTGAGAARLSALHRHARWQNDAGDGKVVGHKVSLGLAQPGRGCAQSPCWDVVGPLARGTLWSSWHCQGWLGVLPGWRLCPELLVQGVGLCQPWPCPAHPTLAQVWPPGENPACSPGLPGDSGLLPGVAGIHRAAAGTALACQWLPQPPAGCSPANPGGTPGGHEHIGWHRVSEWVTAEWGRQE